MFHHLSVRSKKILRVREEAEESVLMVDHPTLI